MTERIETDRKGLSQVWTEVKSVLKRWQVRAEVKSILKGGGDVAQVAMGIEHCFIKHHPFNGALTTEQLKGRLLDFAVGTVTRLGRRFPTPIEDAEDGLLQGMLRLRPHLGFSNTRVARDRFSQEYWQRLQEVTRQPK